MELTLTRPDAAALQVTVTCDGQSSHTFDLFALIPTKTNGLPRPIDDPIAYGTALNAALFPPNSLAQQALAAKPKRIVLVATDEALDAIPWEYTYGSDSFLVCACSFVRGLPAEQRIAPPERLSGLHIIAVASSPLDHHLAPLNIQGEWLRLAEIVGGLDRAVTLERAWPPTIERMRDLVAGEQQRVVHFMGHGGHNDKGEAVLCFEQDNGAREDVTARKFVQRVQGSVFLVTLNACESATPGETAFGNLARALVREQVPYALGMRFSIVDDDALAFSRAFYRNLARGIPVEDALVQARLTLAKSKQAWAVGNLVLYTSLSESAPGYITEPGNSVVPDQQRDALRGILGVLPEVQGAFQGRIDEQIQLGDWLTGDRRPRIMTIHGGGGQGKTALARVAAERFAHAWPGGVWAISLEHLPTKALFVTSLARFLGINPQEITEVAELEQQVLSRLLYRRTLIVLDNAETLIEAVEATEASAFHLVEFIQQLPMSSVSLLATSRRLFGWSGEQSLELRGLSPAQGATLFCQNAPQRLLESDPLLARQLSQRLEGHPLSLILLGKTFHESSISLPAFIAEHEAQLLAASDKYKALTHRQRTLYASIETSLRLLSPELRNLLGRLWVFHAPFLDIVAVNFLDPEHDMNMPKSSPVEGQLAALWQRGLLSQEKVSISGEPLLFYHLLPAIRPFIEQYVAHKEERNPLLARFGAVYLLFLLTLYQDLDRGGAASFIALKTREDLHRAAGYVHDQLQGYYLLWWGWILSRLGDSREGFNLTETALEYGQIRDPQLELQAFNNVIALYLATGQPQRAVDVNEHVQLRMHAIGDDEGEAALLNTKAEAYRMMGNPRQALTVFDQALSLTREAGNRVLEAAVRSNMGRAYRALRQPEQALQCFREALSLAEETGNRAMAATALNNIGELSFLLRQPEQALRWYERAFHLTREVGNRAGEAATLNNMAEVYRTLGQVKQALALHEQVLPIRHEVGDREGEAATLNNLGEAHRELGQFEQAVACYQQALLLDRERHDQVSEAASLNNLGEAYRLLGQPRRALEYHEQALPIRREMDDQEGEAITLHNMAMAYATMGQREKALTYFEQALSTRRAVGDPAGMAETLLPLAHLLQEKQRYAEAFTALEQVVDLSQHLSYPEQIIAHIEMALLLYQSLNRPREAIKSMEQALALLATTDVPPAVVGYSKHDLQQYLQSMRGGFRVVEVPAHPIAMSIGEVQQMVDNTISVMTVNPARRTAWRSFISNARQRLRQQGSQWQPEVDFHDAMLALLDGRTPTIPADHPYAQAVMVMQKSIPKRRR